MGSVEETATIAPPSPPEDWSPPTRLQAADGWWRMRVHALLRGMANLCDPDLRRWRARPLAGPILAEVRSPLWSHVRPDEFVLTAGKVHNLRRAARAFDGVAVPAARRLSFWKQLGRAERWRGFVRGRELRAGCVVPVVGGGVCQLSNALATCASRAGLTLVERHAHSVRPTGTGASDMVDATVLWNYRDLRLRAAHGWQLEVKLDADALIVRIRAWGVDARVQAGYARTNQTWLDTHVPASLRSCVACDVHDCFRHRPELRAHEQSIWLLAGDMPEWRAWRDAGDAVVDVLEPWAPHRKRASDGHRHRALHAAGLAGALWRRCWAHRAGRRQASIIDAQRWLAHAMARRLRPEHRHVVVEQSLLPHLWRSGALGGRRITVLAHALPMAQIEARLDDAMPNTVDADRRGTLRDFRVDPVLVAAESAGLLAAAQVITPHADVARCLRSIGAACTLIPWVMPVRAKRIAANGISLPLVVFPASALARKGFDDLLQALRGMPVRLRVLGSLPALPVPPGVVLEHGSYAQDWTREATLAVLPAHVEHRPRGLLQALAAGVPVIASTACGVDHLDGVVALAPGDVKGLREALASVLGRTA